MSMQTKYKKSWNPQAVTQFCKQDVPTIGY
jgi:hypothetical protein